MTELNCGQNLEKAIKGYKWTVKSTKEKVLKSQMIKEIFNLNNLYLSKCNIMELSLLNLNAWEKLYSAHRDSNPNSESPVGLASSEAGKW